jgi:hypothetical protein
MNGSRLVKDRRTLSALLLATVAIVTAAVPTGLLLVHGSATRTTRSSTAVPASLRQELEHLYAAATSYAGMPGRDSKGMTIVTAAPMSVTAFNRSIDTMSSDHLTRLFESANSFHWQRADVELTALGRRLPPAKLATRLGAEMAALSTSSGATAEPAASQTPPEPETFSAQDCSATAQQGDDGYDGLFAASVAYHIAEAAADAVFVDTAAIPIAFALEIPVQTIQLLINLNVLCSNTNIHGETEVIDKNVVAMENTAAAEQTLAGQIQQLEGQIDQMLDTRTQTIVGQMNTAQASLNAAQQQAIEEALEGGGSTAIASYELPASLGGYLDSTPIGVQAIVTNAMASLQQANQPVNPTASSSLASANAALAAGQYKQAFFYYQAAYEALTK